MNLSPNLDTNIDYIKKVLPLDKSFDLMWRTLTLGETRAFFVGINGFCRTEILQRIFSDLQNPSYTAEQRIEDIAEYVSCKIGYAQTGLTDSWDIVIQNVLSGPSVLFVDGFAQAILIDARTYPARSMEEPDLEKATKGSRDGFVETLLLNANLIRRRVRSPHLCFAMHKVGTDSSTDVAVAYLEDKADRALLDKLSASIDALRVTSLTMGTKSLDELLLPKHWWNPLPSTQTTERPDVACSYLEEGHVLVLVDNSPLVLVLPGTIFQFTQSPDDYYNSPSVGTYFRLVRFLCIPVSMFLMPLFLLFGVHYQELALKWRLLSQRQEPGPLFLYVLVIEFLLDLFKYSSALSSGKFSGSLSLISGLIIGDIAVSLHWASVEVLFYAAVTLLASLAINRIEFADGLRVYRILLIVSTGFFGLPGFLISLVLVILSTVTTPTFAGFSYLWPLFPFNAKALGRLLFRSPTPKAQPTKVWYRGRIKQEK